MRACERTSREKCVSPTGIAVPHDTGNRREDGAPVGDGVSINNKRFISCNKRCLADNLLLEGEALRGVEGFDINSREKLIMGLLKTREAGNIGRYRLLREGYAALGGEGGSEDGVITESGVVHGMGITGSSRAGDREREVRGHRYKATVNASRAVGGRGEVSGIRLSDFDKVFENLCEATYMRNTCVLMCPQRCLIC